MNIDGAVALITGGARRVGRALAIGLAEAGADVVIDYHTSADEADSAVREITALGRRAVAVQADISDPAAIRRLTDEAVASFGRVDILINNASLFERKPVLEITPEDWDRVMGVNLKGPFFMSQAIAPLMMSRSGAAPGAIINILDLSAMQPWPSYAHHAVSKAGLLHLTRVLARALAPGVRVNAIAPGTVLPPDGDEETDEGASGRRVLTRAGAPDDVVSAMLYLLRSDHVTGDVLTVDGGRTLL